MIAGSANASDKPAVSPPYSAPVRGEMSEARRQKMQADAGSAKLKLRERDGALISREVVERFVFERARAERDVWIGWIARTAPDLGA